MVKSYNLDATENQVKQFAIKLIGRYLFCWFLKEKEIIPNSLICSDYIKKTDNYHQLFLQKLFFGILNSRIQDRDWLITESTEIKHFFEKIPYLNGGLFDKTTEDELFATLELNPWLIKFVEVLENYDFTVDESSNQYQQVAVDPEMLGRIFENLLASQNPETEKAANNERKAFGAFYTPREIVDYMVDEGLKTYLAGKLNIHSDELTYAFSANPVWPDKLSKRKPEAEAALKNVKILDPACGSGAFPMGVLHRLISLREILSLQPNTYLLKKEILSNNIYGVDIMPMAIEIARLRAWLSLIVEEDYKGEKVSGNFGIDALPNLDFKFMQGNSLLETFEGIKLFDEKLLLVKIASDKQDLIDKTKNKLNELQQTYITLHQTNQLKGTTKAILDIELKQNKELLTRILKAEEPNANYGLFQTEEHTDNITEKLQKLHSELFSTSEKDRKKELILAIETLEWKLIATTLKEHGKTDKLNDLENLRKQNIRPYFLFKLNFPEVFTEKGGFDIVIGNPPYVRQEAIDPYYKPKYIANHPEVGSGTADLYVYFFDSALSVTNKGGIIIFITLNKYLKTKYGEGLRKKLKDKNVDLIIDFFELPVFEASTDTAITKIINSPDTDTTRYFPVKSLDQLDLNVLTRCEPLKVIKDGSEWKFIDESNVKLLGKFYNNSISLQNYSNDKIYRGLTTGLNNAFIFDEEVAIPIANSESNVLLRKYAHPKGIKKWKIENEKFFLSTGFDIDIENKYPKAYNHLLPFKEELLIRQDKGKKWWNLRACAYYDLFDKPKLIYIRTAKNHTFYFDEEGYYINDSCFLISTSNKYLFFFLNSYLFDWYKRIKFVAYGDADEGGRVKLEYNKMVSVPIKQITDNQLKWFENQYAVIKSVLGNEARVKTLEQEAETMLFKIYELTFNEVKTVCQDFWMDEQDYLQLKFE
ncbi:MAG: Eco57I restriction-modification methylase domain-containing protein [Bacteroidetes bacterium]|nr:Eco57I restriction-modification methylase domain-containing protein [Bacteroidota bacterium]